MNQQFSITFSAGSLMGAVYTWGHSATALLRVRREALRPLLKMAVSR